MHHPRISSKAHVLLLCCSTALGFWASDAQAVSSAELYTAASYRYGRFETRVQFARGDGVVSSFFLWKEGSELPDVYWNELDFEKLWSDCALETNALHGLPEASHNQRHETAADLCGGYHRYAYEWTPDSIAWFIDGVEVRRESGEHAAAFRDNATGGMRIHFNVWPGDESFGGNFNPGILPVHQYIDWIEYSAWVDGEFRFEWREDFNGASVPAGWNTGSWASPKNLSTHAPANVAFIDGYAVLSLTADDATGSAGAAPRDTDQGDPDVDPEQEPEVPNDDVVGSDEPENDDSGGAGGQSGDDDGSASDDSALDDSGSDDSGLDDSGPDDPAGEVDPMDGAGGTGGSSGEAPQPEDMQSSPGSGGTPGAETDGASTDDATSPTTEPPASGATAQPAAPEGTGGTSPSPGAGNPSPTVDGSGAGLGAQPAGAAPPEVSDDATQRDGGCGCRVLPATAAPSWAWLALAAGISLTARRRALASSKR